jgi:hypothetical protein
MCSPCFSSILRFYRSITYLYVKWHKSNKDLGKIKSPLDRYIIRWRMQDKVKKNSVMGKRVPPRGIDRRSSAHILPYWEYRRNIAYMNELYAITKAHLIAFRGRADKKLNKPKITLTKILKINTILRKLQEGV